MTLERIEPRAVRATGDRIRILLRNHTSETRKVLFDLGGNGWAQTRLADLPPEAEMWVEIDYEAPASWPGQDEVERREPRIELTVQQLPLNLGHLDLEKPLCYFYTGYMEQVPEARVATVELDLDQ